jgi:DNA invertase Pin-like site-specific DNA recombinase
MALMARPTPIHDHPALEAAGYVRVSLERQAGGYSPAVQRDAIKRLTAEQGYALTMIEEDHERGSKVTRVGYQKIIEAVRAGTVHAVIVFMFDRWGRDGAEWLTRAREFERLGVPIISVQEGRDEGGLIRFMRAGMAEEYSRQLAKRVAPSRVRAAQAGYHLGPTPIGYKRVSPPFEGSGRRPAAELIADESTAWIVRELYRRYASGGCTIRDLVRWLNTDPRCGPSPAGKLWSVRTTANVLRNPLYRGFVAYNKKPQGLYERAARDAAFTVKGRHEGLVSEELWERVNHRLSAAAHNQTFNRVRTRTGHPVALGAGLLLCAGCGGHVYRHWRATPQGGQYICLTRHSGSGMCSEAGYGATVAHAALLTEVRRLRGTPWTPQAERRLLGGDRGNEVDAAEALQRGLAQERERLRKHTRLMSMMEDDPTAEQIATFREVSAEISARIRGIEAQLATTGQRAAALPDLKSLHERLARTEIGSVVDALVAHGDDEGLRDLVLALVASASLVERVPTYHPTWGRMAVTWSPDVQTLLDARLLRLDPPLPSPTVPLRKELNRMYQQRYRERRAARQEVS